MNHLVQIQTEFCKIALSKDWWSKLRRVEQQEYLSDHPQSKLRVTAPISTKGIEKVNRRMFKNSDGSYSSSGNVRVTRDMLEGPYAQKELKIKFKNVLGNFSCEERGIKSFKNFPEMVGGSLNCYDNNITSFEGAPKSVGKDLDMWQNSLKSMKGCPKVGGSINAACNYDLKSLI